jgi:predicted RNA binding protein YcfA (HicA-like mRNA interferase family)
VDAVDSVLGDAVTVREVIKLIEADGWYLDRQRSSHRQFKHPTKPGLVTVAGHPPKVLAPKTLKSILRQAGLAQ